MKDKIILELESKYFYQLLVQSVRYGCSRNNHLEPDGAFGNLRMFLPIYYEQDNEGAIATAKQICEEIISELNIRFYDGEDDKYRHRKYYLDMILWLLDFIVDNDGEWKPYNWDDYINNLSTDCIKQYFIKDLDTDEILNKEPLSRKEYLDYIMKEIIKSNEATFNRRDVIKSDTEIIKEYVYHIKTPVEINLCVYKIKDVNEGDIND